MKAFYKIENCKAQVGSGQIVPESFIEYIVGKEPQELLDAFIIQQEQENIAKEVADKKAEKEYRLQNIVVTTTNGNEFDGNDLSQSRMVSTIMFAKSSDKTEIQWKLANNEIVLIQIEELEEALALSIDKVGEIITETQGAK